MRQESSWITTPSAQYICMMAPTQQLAEKTREIIDAQGLKGIDVFLTPNGRQGIVECAKTLEEKGARIIVTRKGTQQIVSECTNLKVVGINNTLIDYLWMLKRQGFQSPGLVAFFSYVPIGDEVMQMCELVGVQAKNYIFKTLEDCEHCVEEAIRDGAVFSVGGAWTDSVANRRGFPHLILENSEESILNSLEVAEQLRRIQIEDEQKQEALEIRMDTYQAVLNFTHDAIMSIDDQCRVQVLNPVAERIIGCSAADAIGKQVDQVLPNTMLPEVLRSGEVQTNQIMTINQVMANTNRVPIMVSGQVRGVVATFQDIRQIQSSEQKIRLKLHEKGLVAKYQFSDIRGESAAVKRTIQTARGYAASQAAILVHGETGTGKELFAQSIHNASPRRNGPFVAVNCTTVANNLLESELFGYEAGAFTGAAKNGREGLFELAHGGTIFLDEIGEIPRETQVELLRVLQEKEIRRVGGNRVIPVDVRIITATNRDLIQEVINGNFREDLYYRLNVLSLEVPPLRERGDDVRLLGQAYFDQLSGVPQPDLRQRYLELLEQLREYPWYGNIRELQNFTERLHILLSNGAEIDSVMTELMRRRSAITQPQEEDGVNQDAVQEQALIRTVLEDYSTMDEAARFLGVSRQTLWRKMKKYGIHR